MNRRKFLSGISFGAAFLSFLPLKKLFALNSMHSVSSIPIVHQIRHGAILSNANLVSPSHGWIESVCMQTFFSNGLSKSKHDLSMLSLKIEGENVNLITLEDEVLVNYKEKELRIAANNSSPATIQLNQTYFIRVIDLQKEEKSILSVKADAKIFCLKGETNVNGSVLKEGQLMSNIFEQEIHSKSSELAQLCIIERNS